MPNRANPQHYLPLREVVTLAEAARLSYCDPKSITCAIDVGSIAALKCGGVWLVSVASLKQWQEQKFRKTG